jgi:hypothetical protein
MEKRQSLYVETPLDPFTVLKVCQLLREIPAGKSLKLLVKGEKMPDELGKILAPEHYHISVEQSTKNPLHIDVIIKKRAAFTGTIPSPRDSGGCCG